VIVSPAQNALLYFFEKKMLNGEKLVTPAVSAAKMTDVTEKVAVTPGALGLTSFGFSNDKVKAIKHSEIGRPLTLFSKTAPSEPMRNFLLWLKKDGQKFMLR
jgi:ABC-type phosphate transport system substrate-binding protein